MNFKKLAVAVTAVGCLAVAAGAEEQAKVPFDAREAEALLEPGESTLVGRLYAITSARKALIPIFQQRKYGSDMMVYLLPMTAHVKSVTDGVPSKQLFYAVLSGLDGQSEGWSARVLTDSEGRFRFRALKPGKYLLLASIPYKADAFTREYQGEMTTTTFVNNIPIGFSSESIYLDGPTHKIDLDHTIVRIVTIEADEKETDVGDVD